MTKYLSNGLRRAGLATGAAMLTAALATPPLVLATTAPAAWQIAKVYENGVYDTKNANCIALDFEGEQLVICNEKRDDGTEILRQRKAGRLTDVSYLMPDGTSRNYYVVSAYRYEKLKGTDIFSYIVEGGAEYVRENSAAEKVEEDTIRNGNRDTR